MSLSLFCSSCLYCLQLPGPGLEAGNRTPLRTIQQILSSGSGHEILLCPSQTSLEMNWRLPHAPEGNLDALGPDSQTWVAVESRYRGPQGESVLANSPNRISNTAYLEMSIGDDGPELTISTAPSPSTANSPRATSPSLARRGPPLASLPLRGAWNFHRDGRMVTVQETHPASGKFTLKNCRSLRRRPDAFAVAIGVSVLMQRQADYSECRILATSS